MPNPDNNLLLIDDVGDVYFVPEGQWRVAGNKLDPNKPTDATTLGAVDRLASYGTYLASIPSLGIDLGEICVVVNVAQAVKGQPSDAQGKAMAARAEGARERLLKNGLSAKI